MPASAATASRVSPAAPSRATTRWAASNTASRSIVLGRAISLPGVCFRPDGYKLGPPGCKGLGCPLAAEVLFRHRISARRAARARRQQDRKGVLWGKGVSVRVDLGGRRIIKKKRTNRKTYKNS